MSDEEDSEKESELINISIDGCLFFNAAQIICCRPVKHAFLTRPPIMFSMDAQINEAKSSNPYSVGIDLGTTYSLVSILLPPTRKDDGKVEAKYNRSAHHLPLIVPIESLRMMPSVVSYSKTMDNISIKVGADALNGEKFYGSNMQVFTSVKRVIGRSIRETRDLLALSRSSNAIISKSSDMSILAKVNRIYDRKEKDTENACQLTCAAVPLGVISPEEVSAEILKKLLAAATDYLETRTAAGKESIVIENAVITVPAYFSNAQRNATIRAGEMAGLKKVKLLKEPEAAALAYGLLQRQPQLVLVFDLGGGTFDVSVLEVGGGFVEVIATSGDGFLGGDDFDAAIMRWLQKSLQDSDPDLANLVKDDAIAQEKIWAAAVAAKVQLSTATAVNISIPDLARGKIFSVELTRPRFHSLCKDLLTRLLKPLREVSLMAGVNLPGESGQVGLTSEMSMAADGVDEDEEDGSFPTRVGDGEAVDRNSIRRLKEAERSGKANAKLRNKTKGKTNKELRKLQREYSDPALALFPGGQQLDDVILVGGATRMPCIVNLVRTVTGIDPRRSVNPDEAVCQGAGIWAGILDGVIDDMQVMSAWQAAIFRTFYAEKQKGKQLFDTSNSMSDDSNNLDSKPSSTLPASDIDRIEKKKNISDSNRDSSSRPNLFKRLRNKKPLTK